MKNRLYGILAAISLITLSAVLAPGFARAEQTAGLGLARVTFISGDALFLSGDTEEWAELSPNFTLQDGDRLWVGEDSKVEIGFAGGHRAWLNYLTGLDIAKLERDRGSDAHQVALTSGEGSFAVRDPGRDGVFQVDTPNASVRAYERAAFRVTSLSDGTTQIGVSRGKIELESDEGITDVKAGEMVEVDKSGQVYYSDLPGPDYWDDWVASRWDRYSRPPRSARYLPPNLDYYGYEFDEGGRWTSYPEYGNVWVPRVSAGWSPYSNGRWVWRANDYVWLPYDPWYAPFHYGRWHWRVSLGWFWLPPVPGDVFWSPGYVSWSWGPDVVSWVPLGPREVYYGYGYYGPRSVNIHKTKIVNITNIYVNSRVNNGVVVVKKDRFLRGETTRIKVRDRDNPFRSRGALGTRVIARPPVEEIRPIKETKVPKPGKRLGLKELPPERFEKESAFVKQRSVARGDVKSAFKPERKPERMKEMKKRERPEPFRATEEKGRAKRERMEKEKALPGAEPREKALPDAEPREKAAPAERETAPVEREKGRRGPEPRREMKEKKERPERGRVEAPQPRREAAPEAGQAAPETRGEAAPRDKDRRGDRREGTKFERRTAGPAKEQGAARQKKRMERLERERAVPPERPENKEGTGKTRERQELNELR